MEEDALLIHRDSSGAHGSSEFQSSMRSSRRICSRLAGIQVLGSFLHDPHSVCVWCRDGCIPGKRSGEWTDWSHDKVLAAFTYQCSLSCKRVAKAKYRCKSADPLLQPNIPSGLGSSPPTAVPYLVHEARDSGSRVLSVDGSVLSLDGLTAEDSASQQGSKLPGALDLSLFFKSCQEEVLASVADLFASQLDLPSSSDQDLMQFSVPFPSSPDRKRCARENHLGTRGASYGHAAVEI
ncbi:hypothetical protein E2C01_048142 [Portunus trituberculatus]|uniref:Uncharacterized protein n=1 Tax=Portunus trituberculatus TaxID=210409 RepID=A0A5B7G5M5_PORTR|nr:hypothetical protein [Portunus trituberculatus]